MKQSPTPKRRTNVLTYKVGILNKPGIPVVFTLLPDGVGVYDHDTPIDPAPFRFGVTCCSSGEEDCSVFIIDLETWSAYSMATDGIQIHQVFYDEIVEIYFPTYSNTVKKYRTIEEQNEARKLDNEEEEEDTMPKYWRTVDDEGKTVHVENLRKRMRKGRERK